METNRMFTVIVILLFISLSFQQMQATMMMKKRDYILPGSLKHGELNDQCRNESDCRTFGYVCAFNKTCQCSDEYLPNYKLKVCLGGIEQKCQYDEHCIDGAFCMNQSTCKCKDREPIPSFDGLKCTSTTSSQSLSTLAIIASTFLIRAT